MPAGRPRLRGPHEPAGLLGPGRGRAPVRGAGAGPGGERGPVAGRARVDGRPHAAGDHDRVRAAGSEREQLREHRVQRGRRGRRHGRVGAAVRVPAGRRDGVQRVREPGELRGPERGLAPGGGAGDRSGGERGRLAGGPRVDGTQASHSWTVDLTPPETSVSAGPADPSGSRSASISFEGEDDRSAASALRFECRLDDETEFSACASPVSYAELAEGAHAFEVRAIDLAGNVDPSAATHAWTIDTTAPETSIGDGPPDPSAESSARFEFMSNEPGSRFECRLDEGDFASCETGEFYPDLTDSEHRFE